jgi:hypothetical protein
MGWLVKDELSDKKRQQLIEDAKPVLLPGEHILDATGGMVEVHRHGGSQSRRGTLAVTDQRVFLYTNRVGGYDVQDFAYGLLSACNYSTGAGFGTIELVTVGERTRITQVLKEEAKRIGPLVRHQMAFARGTASSAQMQEDPTEQLRKLTELRDANLLTEEEFQTKRAAIIDRL